jgi:hypothetical protein
MKKIILILLVLFQGFAFSQSGTYTMGNPSSNGTIVKWTLTLNPDGTFLYHFLRDLSATSKYSTEENFYGKGTWKLNKKIIEFSADSTDFNEKFTVNLNNAKARYITKSPRNISTKVIRTGLRFYASENSYIKGLQLFKN